MEKIWIGLKREDSSGDWLWDDGTLADWTYLADDSNKTGKRLENCVSLTKKEDDYFLRPQSCGAKLPFLCQEQNTTGKTIFNKMVFFYSVNLYDIFI